MPRDEPSFIVAPGECDEFGAQVLDGFERPHPEQVLLQGSDEALGDAVALGFAHEGRRSFDAQTFDLVLEIAGHVIGAMIVTQLEPTRHARRHVAVSTGTGKTHIALGIGLAACQKRLSVGFYTAAALVHELLEARDEKRLLRLQRQVAGYKLLIIDELGYVPLSQTGAELLFEIFSQRYERGSTIVTSNLPFDEWTGVFGSERLTGALLDRLTHHVHILEMNGDSYRLNQSKRRSRRNNADPSSDDPTQA